MIKITSPGAAVRYFKPRLGADVEEFWVAALNADKQVTASRCLFRGTVDHCLFHPRDVFRFACVNNASALVVAHNHPSGSPEPSREDIAVTEQLLMLSLVMEIPIVDHVIVAGARYYSFLEQGSLKLGATNLAWPSAREPGRY